MRIIVTGGTGFLGRPLCQALLTEGHQVVVLTRSDDALESAKPSQEGRSLTHVRWSPDGTAGPWAQSVDGAGVVVNLAGESIAGRRWSPAQKAKIRDSRLRATRSLVAAISAVRQPPPVLVSGSAIGYYGPRADEPLTEESPPGSDFLGTVCVEWEKEAARAGAAGVRVVMLRTGIVLEKDGGALPQMLTPFKLFVGGPLGSGQQVMSWIHREDWIQLARMAIRTEEAAGPINATAPNPVTNAEFSRALGRSLGRPSFMPAPAFAIRTLLGEMADALLLSGQRVLPARAQDLGFKFRHTSVEGALRAILA